MWERASRSGVGKRGIERSEYYIKIERGPRMWTTMRSYVPSVPQTLCNNTQVGRRGGDCWDRRVIGCVTGSYSKTFTFLSAGQS
jgi:hypothetical protein